MWEALDEMISKVLFNHEILRLYVETIPFRKLFVKGGACLSISFKYVTVALDHISCLK